MSIAGIGVDVVAVGSFAEQLSIEGSRFAEVFTPAERELRAPGRPLPEHLAARWAAKEAFLKAWSGANFGAPPHLDDVSMRDIEVVRDAWGRPSLRLHGPVRDAVSATLPGATTHLSLSHDGDVACAYVVIELPLEESE